MAYGGNGNPTHVAGELFKMMTGINMLHVPYRGGGPALADLLGGQVQVCFTNIIVSIEYIRAGQLRALAVTTSSRSEALPEIPSLSEFLPGYEAVDWKGMVAPKNTPPAIIERLNRALGVALNDSVVVERFADLGYDVVPPQKRSSAYFDAFYKAEVALWATVLRDLK